MRSAAEAAGLWLPEFDVRVYSLAVTANDWRFDPDDYVPYLCFEPAQFLVDTLTHAGRRVEQELGVELGETIWGIYCP